MVEAEGKLDAAVKERKSRDGDQRRRIAWVA